MWGRVVALDADVTTYLMQANTQGYDPAQDSDKNLAREKGAAFLIFLHVERIVALPTVKGQVADIPDVDLQLLHQGFGQIHLDEPQLDDAVVIARARCLGQHHNGGDGAEKDCRIVAEAELACADVLLSFDADLRKHVGPHARIPLKAPLSTGRISRFPEGQHRSRCPTRHTPSITRPGGAGEGDLHKAQ